jgi:hypothetical protein
MFPTNREVQEHNDYRISQMLRTGVEYIVVTARDRFAHEEHTNNPGKYDITKLMPKDPQKTGSLMKEMTLCRGVRVMIRRNIAISDKLANGSIGVVHSWDEKLNTVFVDMNMVNDLPVGQKTRVDWMKKHSGSNHNAMLRERVNMVPIVRDSADVTSPGSHSIAMVRNQYPFVPAFAVSIHKTQGLCDGNNVQMKGLNSDNMICPETKVYTYHRFDSRQGSHLSHQERQGQRPGLRRH